MTAVEPDNTALDAGTAPAELWWRRPFGMFQTNIREIDADLDVHQVLDDIQNYGAVAWMVSVGGIISNYPTNLPFQTRNPVLDHRPSHDMVGDALREAHARGVKLVARMDFSKVPHALAEAHPDWCFVDSHGERQTYNGLVSTCPSGPCYQQNMFAIVTEVLENYAVDGFFFNWMDFNEHDYDKVYRGVCQCRHCWDGFTKAFPGMALPEGPADAAYQHWQRYAAATLYDLTDRARRVISAMRPEAPLIMEEPSGDIIFHEGNHKIGDTVWHFQTEEAVSLAKSRRPNQPVLVNAMAYIDVPYRLAGEEPERFAQYLIQAISRGAIPSTYIMATPDRIRYESLRVGADITRFHARNRDLYDGLVSIARTALVRPSPLQATADSCAQALAEFRGVYVGLTERHVPFDVVGIESLAEVDLRRYALLILPDLGALGSAVTTAVDEWVFDGGRLLVLGSSGFDNRTMQLRSSGAADELAVLRGRRATWSMHLHGAAASTSPDDFPIPVIGSYHVTTLRNGATSGMSVLSRAPYGPPEKCYGHVEIGDQPGWINYHYGRGASTTMPWTPGTAYRSEGLTAHRDALVDRLLGLLGADRQLETTLPEQVGITLARGARGVMVSINNLTGMRQHGFTPPADLPAHRLTLDPGGAVSAARALVAD